MDGVFFPEGAFWPRLFGASFGRLDDPFLWGSSSGARGAKNDLIPFFGWLLATTLRLQFANRFVELVDVCVFPAEKKEAMDVCALWGWALRVQESCLLSVKSQQHRVSFTKRETPTWSEKEGGV
jgi:hypothetical protein